MLSRAPAPRIGRRSFQPAQAQHPFLRQPSGTGGPLAGSGSRSAVGGASAGTRPSGQALPSNWGIPSTANAEAGGAATPAALGSQGGPEARRTSASEVSPAPKDSARGDGEYVRGAHRADHH